MPKTLPRADASRRSLLAVAGVFGVWLPSEMLGASQSSCEPDVLRSHLVTAKQARGTPLLAVARQAAAPWPSRAANTPDPATATANPGHSTPLSDTELHSRIARYQVTAPLSSNVQSVALSAADPHCGSR